MTSPGLARAAQAVFRSFIVFVVALVLANAPVAFAASAKPKNAAAEDAQAAAASAVASSYVLGTGDKLRLIVFGEEDLSGEFVVDDAGFVRLPLIGQMTATGRTVRELEDDIAAKLGAQYLKNPRVSIEVLNYRPFYILGEVNKPGEYPYVAGMSVLNAVAMAGGYTYRANESSVHIKRKGAQDEEKYPADDTTKLMPGDIVNVSERWF